MTVSCGVPRATRTGRKNHERASRASDARHTHSHSKTRTGLPARTECKFWLEDRLCITGGSGCASHHSSAEVSRQASGFHPLMPDRLFPQYQAIFKYIAACEGLPQDGQTILGLAADSAVERSQVEAVGTLLVIRAEYYGRSGRDRFGIRGGARQRALLRFPNAGQGLASGGDFPRKPTAMGLRRRSGAGARRLACVR